MKKRMKNLLAFVLALGICAANIPARAAINDIAGHWGAEAIQYCLDQGYMDGMGSGQFLPDGPVTRAQVVQVLYRMSGSPDTNGLENPFKDSQSHWGREAIQWASSTGVVLGTSATTFAPHAKVTREQVATMFMRYAGQDGSNTHNDFILNGHVLSGFPDREKIAPWHLGGVAWALQYGFMQGSNGQLAPTGIVTRAQLAQFIKNYYEPGAGVQPAPGTPHKYANVKDVLENPEEKAWFTNILKGLVTPDIDIELAGNEENTEGVLFCTFILPADAPASGEEYDSMVSELEKFMDDHSDTFMRFADHLCSATGDPYFYCGNYCIDVSFKTYGGKVACSKEFCFCINICL